MRSMVQTPLPVDRYLDEIVEHVRRERFAVVVAPPGSGKTTRIPPALVAIGRTMLLQPRRVAARALTRRIALERGWTIGDEIGWQIRFEKRYSERTRLLVATEGILTARLQSDPLLSEFEVVVLDEFHERSIHADLALALVREAARSRDDLHIVVMSATMDAESVAGYLGSGPQTADRRPPKWARAVTPLPAGEGGHEPEPQAKARGRVRGLAYDLREIHAPHPARGDPARSSWPTVRLSDGTICKAEIHWYEAHGIGKKELKFKRPLLD
jgi:hypothetical protein